MAEQGRTFTPFRIPEQILLALGQADMNMAATAGLPHGRLGHERDRPALLGGDLLYPVLEDGVPIGNFNRRAIGKIYLVLSPAPFAFARFDLHLRGAHVVADRSEERFVLAGLQDVIIDPIITGGL